MAKELWSRLRRRRRHEFADLPDSVPFGGALTDAFYESLRRAVESKLADGEDPEALAAQIVAHLPLDDILESTTAATYASMREKLPGQLKYLADEDQQLAAAMQTVWGEADGLYRACAYLGYEIGDAVARSTTEHGPKMVALLGAHGRAVLIAAEVRHLAMGGFDSGASARWRSLHDLAVLCSILNTADVSISRRYLAYAYIEAWKDLRVYQEHAAAIGYEPFTDDESAIAKQNADEVANFWGKDMRKPHGWAFPLFPGREKVDFIDLESLAGLSHLRPFYKLGNNYIHAGPRAADLNSRTDELAGAKAINIGATVFADIAETCHGAMISLLQATSNLVVAQLGVSGEGAVDLLVGLQAQSRFVADGGDAWVAAADRARARGWFSHKP